MGKRPTGVTVLAILDIVGGALSLLLGAGVYSSWSNSTTTTSAKNACKTATRFRSSYWGYWA